jgi:hypothetical protein
MIRYTEEMEHLSLKKLQGHMHPYWEQLAFYNIYKASEDIMRNWMSIFPQNTR